jgi:hypothetical protein
MIDSAGLKECWKHRLQVLKKDLGYDDAPLLEKLLIQQSRVVLAEAEPCRIELFRHDGTITYINPRHVWGKAVERCTEAFHARL